MRSVSGCAVVAAAIMPLALPGATRGAWVDERAPMGAPQRATLADGFGASRPITDAVSTPSVVGPRAFTHATISDPAIGQPGPGLAPTLTEALADGIARALLVPVGATRSLERSTPGVSPARALAAPTPGATALMALAVIAATLRRPQHR